MTTDYQKQLDAYLGQYADNVELRLHPQSDPSIPADRYLVATRDYKIGEVIFTESPILHTQHPYAQTFQPSTNLNLAFDWQRILHLYAHLRTTDDGPECALVKLGLNVLSVDGATNAIAQEEDEDKLKDHKESAKAWVNRWKERRRNKNKKKKKGGAAAPAPAAGEEEKGEEWVPTVEEIERLIHVLETNCHSRSSHPDPVRGETASPTTSTSTKGDDWEDEDAAEKEDEDEEEEEEQCGLFLLASFMNHSCLPTASVLLPLASSSPPTLTLICTKPIKTGEEVTISYHDQEFIQTEDRRMLLRRRGFVCECVMCSGDVADYARAALCTNSGCTDGIASPTASGWLCDTCSHQLSDEQVSEIEQAEEEWEEEWEELGSSPLITALVSSLISHISTTPLADPNTCQPPSLLKLREATSPLHPAHTHISSLIRHLTFTPTLITPLRLDHGLDTPFHLLQYLLSSAYRLLRLDRGVEGSVRGLSEEVRHLAYWLAKEGKDLGGREGVKEGERERFALVEGWAEGVWGEHGRGLNGQL
ncbi:SET domain-containing protein [Saitoella complicata NRRL Y-17804]|uniref:SET domain-containing protein n=1 Tax=Saitoella complicata (strain BCRC 22490 / CBS 7301 / JCM 7358 / NBRC 10748 / NRRL Y-17804) TaxID=698492 RepID=A0A0E9NB13_SAICN|nr:SET domain-containing protein [Saitoella complicata NRRL Y-17804]ODQ51356.1 SET domain-containing protein [Saitoella complicata NRRL Y-17804]GAO46600.1 hypothetical protein G7K_0827-t1 [Saitoella complicata NRRL Y-17804]